MADGNSWAILEGKSCIGYSSDRYEIPESYIIDSLTFDAGYKGSRGVFMQMRVCGEDYCTVYGRYRVEHAMTIHNVEITPDASVHIEAVFDDNNQPFINYPAFS